MKFGEVLREERKRSRCTQDEFAKKLGISRASLSLYETGKQTPGLDVLDSLHKVTGAPLEYLMGYTDNYTKETIGIDKNIGLSTESVEELKKKPVLGWFCNLICETNVGKMFAAYVAIGSCRDMMFRGYNQPDHQTVPKDVNQALNKIARKKAMAFSETMSEQLNELSIFATDAHISVPAINGMFAVDPYVTEFAGQLVGLNVNTAPPEAEQKKVALKYAEYKKALEEFNAKYPWMPRWAKKAEQEAGTDAEKEAGGE